VSCLLTNLLLAVLVLSAGCGSVRSRIFKPFRGAGLACSLRPPEDMGSDLFLRQRVRAEFAENDRSFDAVLQKKGNILRVVFLAPVAGKAFVIEQRGREVEVISDLGLDLPFPPCRILVDIERTFFPYLSADAVPTGDARRTVAETPGRVVEVWKAGILQERLFYAARDSGHLEMRITYRFKPSTVAVPARVTIEARNPPYRLTVDTLAAEDLRPR